MAILAVADLRVPSAGPRSGGLYDAATLLGLVRLGLVFDAYWGVSVGVSRYIEKNTQHFYSEAVEKPFMVRCGTG